jgi:hypothetical protein
MILLWPVPSGTIVVVGWMIVPFHRALDDGLRRGLPLCGVGGHHRGSNEAAERSGNKQTQH